MIKIIFKVFAMLIAVLPLNSCLPEPLEVEGIPKAKPRIVVSSQMLGSQGVVVLLTKTVGALEAGDNSDPMALIGQISVNDAVVTIESDTGSDTMTFRGLGIYSIRQELQTGKTYRLNVNSKSLGMVSATAEVKPQVVFGTVEARVSITPFDTMATVTYSFNDLPGNNWYMVNAQRITSGNIQETVLNPWFTSFLIEQKDITGPVYHDTLTLISRRFSEGDTLMVSLANISSEYFRFLKLRGDARFSLTDFLGEPVNYPSNVKGGYGFFNLHLPDVRVYRVKENGAEILSR